MKLHKFTIYVFDNENYGIKNIEYLLNNIKYLTTTTFHNNTVDIGEWSDDHILNKFSADQLTFDEYFV